MHEFSLCRGIVGAVLQELEGLDPPALRLVRVRLEVGRLHQIIPDYLQSAWGILTRETAAEGGEMELVVVPIGGGCRDCGWAGEIEPPIFLCPACGSAEVEVSGGDELRLTGMEVEVEDE
jgi:hydrogenase nickel incorporation protein HypA/HybF